MNQKLNLVLLLFILFVSPIAAQVNRAALEKQLKEVIAGKKAEIGIAVIINGKDTLTLNNEVRYPMMSVFKFHQALSVAHYLEQKGLPLTTPVHIRKSDLKPNTYSPLRDKYPEGDIDLSGSCWPTPYSSVITMPVTFFSIIRAGQRRQTAISARWVSTTLLFPKPKTI